MTLTLTLTIANLASSDEDPVRESFEALHALVDVLVEAAQHSVRIPIVATNAVLVQVATVLGTIIPLRYIISTRDEIVKTQQILHITQ